MPPVFGHGRLRLYLLKLLHESPRHGYELIRLLEERFQGLYSPSAGTVYPRLAKLAAEGLVAHTEEGGRKVYSLTVEGEQELAARESELAGLEREIRESLAALAAEVQDDVSGSAHTLREELWRAAADAAEGGDGRGRRRGAGRGEHRVRPPRAPKPAPPGGPSSQAWGHHEETVRAAREHFEQAAQRIQEQVQRHAAAGDWQSALREGMDGLSQEIGGFSRLVSTPWPMDGFPAGAGKERTGGTADAADAADDAADLDGGVDPRRELERMLDRFRDEVRDVARDRGVTRDQLRMARRQLSTATAHLTALLHDADAYREGTGER
jgi:DNA-binding PadR family transcriptional regulator